MAGARQHRAEEGAFARPTKGGAMRTRIALVAIIPVALITVSTLTQAASVQSARAVTTRSSGTTTATAMPADQLTALHTPGAGSPQAGGSDVSFDLAASLLSGRPIGILGTVPAAVPAPATVLAPAPAPPARSPGSRSDDRR